MAPVRQNKPQDKGRGESTEAAPVVNAPPPLPPLRHALVYAGLVLLAAGLYRGALSVPWHYDDKVEIVLNKVLQNPLEHLGKVWAYNPFRFLLELTFAFDLARGKGAVEPFHRVNIALHAANAILVWHLLRHALPRALPRSAAPGGWPGLTPLSLFGAVFFAAHPLAVESVTYISGRSESLSTLFCLLGLYLYGRFLEGEEAHPQESASLRSTLGRVNRGLGSLLAAAVVGGLPTVWAVQKGWISPTRGWLVGLAGGGVILALILGRRGNSTISGKSSGSPASPRVMGYAFRSLGLLAACFLLYLLGCITKETAATLPLALFAWEWTLFRRGNLLATLPRLKGALFPFLGIPATLLAFRYAFYGAVGSPITVRPLGVNLLTEAEVLWRYAWLFLWPQDLSIYHDHPEATSLLSPWTLLAVTGLLGVLVLALRGVKSHPGLSLPVFLAGAALLPSSSVFPLKETMAEHRTYPSQFAVALLVVVIGAMILNLLGKRLRKEPILALATAAALLLLGGYGARIHTYNAAFRSEKTLWERAVALNPEAGEAWYQLGDLARYGGDLDAAEKHYRECLKWKPNYVDAYNNLGILYAQKGEPQKALSSFQQALSIRKCYTQAMNNTGRIYQSQGKFTEAAFVWQQVLQECDPENYLAHRLLGDLYYQDLPDRQKAMEYYQRVWQLDPTHPATELVKKRLQELSW